MQFCLFVFEEQTFEQAVRRPGSFRVICDATISCVRNAWRARRRVVAAPAMARARHICTMLIGGKPESRSRVYPPSTWGNCDSVDKIERQCAHARPPARPPAVSKGSYGWTNGRIRPHLRPPPPATMRTPKYPNCTTFAFSNLNKKMKRLRTAAEKMLLYWNALRGSKI